MNTRFMRSKILTLSFISAFFLGMLPFNFQANQYYLD